MITPDVPTRENDIETASDYAQNYTHPDGVTFDAVLFDLLSRAHTMADPSFLGPTRTASLGFLLRLASCYADATPAARRALIERLDGALSDPEPPLQRPSLSRPPPNLRARPPPQLLVTPSDLAPPGPHADPTDGASAWAGSAGDVVARGPFTPDSGSGLAPGTVRPKVLPPPSYRPGDGENADIESRAVHPGESTVMRLTAQLEDDDGLALALWGTHDGEAAPMGAAESALRALQAGEATAEPPIDETDLRGSGRGGGAWWGDDVGAMATSTVAIASRQTLRDPRAPAWDTDDGEVEDMLGREMQMGHAFGERIKLILFDFETTGRSTEKDRIIEVAAAVVAYDPAAQRWMPTGATFDALVDPGMPISAGASGERREAWSCVADSGRGVGSSCRGCDFEASDALCGLFSSQGGILFGDLFHLSLAGCFDWLAYLVVVSLCSPLAWTGHSSRQPHMQRCTGSRTRTSQASRAPRRRWKPSGSS